MASLPNLLDPRLLKKSINDSPLDIFLCGPGVGSASYEARQRLRCSLAEHKNVSVLYGEDLPASQKYATRGIDLQTMETEHAHTVDFTILMLETPGSIAELGTFSMMKNIAPRLFVALPVQHHGSDSYIARGPLSVIANYSKNNVVYYDPRVPNSLIDKLRYPILMYKFARFHSRDYYTQVKHSYRSRSTSFDYKSFFAPIKSEFLACMTLIAIYMGNRPTFSDLAVLLRFAPEDISEGLKILYSRNKIRKLPGARYEMLCTLSDPILSCFSSTAISRKRASLLAA